ncbi:hypothetical protein SLOPH_1118 [Spraguea lophii 42_110]|uniref:MRG domain-containing protein n=1 Tax=Spraguea lophii (strain 42_110) TaxID=1358809 RepID=S7XRC7_SPRLO|nr:hypothetical protein SLOPH_1118 [Spraguea lophii 42_110]
MHKNFYINNYVFLKYNDEWIEGRILEINKDDTTNTNKRKSYILFNVKTSTIIPTPFFESSIHISSTEILKKFKIKKLEYNPDKLYMPVQLKDILFYNEKQNIIKQQNTIDQIEIDDKIYNKLIKYNVNNILDDFYYFLEENKPSVHIEEFLEVRKGLMYYFKNFVDYFILKEEKSITNNDDNGNNTELSNGNDNTIDNNDNNTVYNTELNNDNTTDNDYNDKKLEKYNYIHLLRLLVFIHYNVLPKETNIEISTIIFDYYYYLIDFLIYKLYSLKEQ